MSEEAATMPSTSALVAEFVGTFMLIFTVGCNVLSANAVWGGVSIACVLMVMIYALGGVSGANFNPAVSFALGLSKQLGGDGLAWKTVGCYCGVQLIAGVLAKVGYRMLYGDYFVLGAGEGYGYFNAGLVELLYTCILCFVVLNVAVAKKNAENPNQFYGLAIGFVIIAGAYGAGGVSGGCFNPAVAFGITSMSPWTILYTVFELLGAALAVGLFMVVRPGDFGKEQSDVTKLASEFIGTYVLVLTVGLNVLAKSPAAAFSIAAGLMSMIYALGDVSGAHFNPAVTVAIMVGAKGISPIDAAKYIGSQIAGGMLASVTYSAIMQGRSFPLGAKNGSTWSQVAVAEIVFTFVLCYVVLGAAVDAKTKTKEMFGLAIGSCVTVGGFAIGGISGGSLNPAVSIGIATTSFSISTAVIYSVFELIGAGLAAGVYKITHEPEAVMEEKGADEKASA